MAKGSKTCTNCKAEVAGPRTKVCPSCGTEFAFANQVRIIGENGEPVLIDSSEATRMVFSYPDGYQYPETTELLHVSIPAGPCPIPLRGTEDGSFPSDDKVIDWAGDVRQEMINKGMYLRNKALIYWARTELNKRNQFAPLGDEMVYLGLVINQIPDITTREIPA